MLPFVLLLKDSCLIPFRILKFTEGGGEAEVVIDIPIPSSEEEDVIGSEVLSRGGGREPVTPVCGVYHVT